MNKEKTSDGKVIINKTTKIISKLHHLCDVVDVRTTSFVSMKKENVISTLIFQVL